MSFTVWGKLAILLMASMLQAIMDIDWASEITKAVDLSNKDFDLGLTNEIAEDIFAPGFVRLTPHAIIEGDFTALAARLQGRVQKGRVVLGSPHIVGTCGNSAVVWQTVRREIYDQGKSILMKGKAVLLYQYIDGKAKIKFLHDSI